MAIDIYPKEALLTVARAAQRPIAFLVGAPLSMDSKGGVPGVAYMLDLVREEIRARAVSELPRFEDAIRGKSGGNVYQAAMKWLQGNLTQDAVNQVVRVAVLLARKPEAAGNFEYDGEACDWHLPIGSQELASLVCNYRERFPGPIITTNFDPLLSLAVESYGGRPHLRIIQSDGGLGHDVKRTGEIEVVHLHGFWRDSDTLHTPAQLTAARPRLKDSLKEILRQRTLVVVAYGGWDDVFAGALAEVALDEAAQVNVLWCFRDADANEVERNNERLLERVQPAITRGRFAAYGGIDCHSIFGEMAAALSSTAAYAPVISAGFEHPPIAGWRLVNAAFLGSLQPLGAEEIVCYFDGAVPNWRHAISGDIPRRQDVTELGVRLTRAQNKKATCTLQLIRAAGGEGKSTLLLQAAADAAYTDGWTILWRPSPSEGLPPEHVARLDPSRQWLIVADDADNLIRDLTDSAQRLSRDGRANLHFLLAARDADWKAAKGDEQPWGEWLTKQPDIVLRDIAAKDAELVVRAWAKYEKEGGLRELANYSDTAGRVAALRDAVHDAANEQRQQLKRRKPVDGSFFGGLLSVRFGQDGLQAHVRKFLKRLKDISMESANANLFDALLYVTACHGVGISGINEKVLADLVEVPRDWVQSYVVRPLGEEAAAVHSAGHVLTRHSKVAAAVLVEAEQTFDVDLSEFWTQIVRQTVQTGRELRMDRQWFSRVVHVGPRLQRALPLQLTEDRCKDIAIAAANAAKKYKSEWLGCVDSLARTYRNAGDIEEAVRLFRDGLGEAQSKVDYNQVIRAYWYEWSVCEGLRGKEREHSFANAWLGGLSLSDYLNPAPVTTKDMKLICAGLGIVFGRLAQSTPNCPYAKARRAASYLGRLTSNEPKAVGYYNRHDKESDKLRTPHPKDVAEAVAWLAAGVARAGHELRDPFLKGLAKPSQVSFAHFRSAL